MKKSLLILILVVYIASIVAIGFFGVKIETFNVTVYVKSIEITNEDVIMDENQVDKYIVIQFEPYENEIDNTNHVQLQWKVFPENSTDRGVTFEHSPNTKATVNEFGTVIFTGKTTLTIYITSTDGTNVREKIKVVCY